MAILFWKKSQKLPKDWGLLPWSPVCDTCEYHQFAHYAATLPKRHIFQAKKDFEFKLTPINKIMVSRLWETTNKRFYLWFLIGFIEKKFYWGYIFFIIEKRFYLFYWEKVL